MNFYDFILMRNWAASSRYLWNWEIGGQTLFRVGLFIRRIWFALRFLCGSLKRGRSTRSLRIDRARIRKILILRTDRIGDIVLSMPAMGALRGAYPESEIHVLVQENYAPLLNCYPGWDRVLTLPRTAAGIRYLRGLLRAEQYDVAIVQHPSRVAYRLAQASAAPVVLGWKAKGYGYLLTHGSDDDRAVSDAHQVQNNLELLEPLGIVGPPPPFQVLETEEGSEAADTFLKKNGIEPGDRILTIHPGSYAPRVRWMADRFAEIAERADRADYRVVLIGSGGDRSAVESVRASCTTSPLLAIDAFDLEGLVSFLLRSFVFLGNSTGPMHISASVGTWTVALFGNRYPLDRIELWRPWGPSGRTVQADVPCCGLPWTCRDLPCFGALTVDQVWQTISKLPDNTPPP